MTTSSIPYLLCISGPDQGKRLALSATEMVIGRATDANLLSDDPELTDHFASVRFDGASVHVHALGDQLLFLDGHPVADALLTVGHQLRLGRSTWTVLDPGTPHPVFGFVNRLGDHLSSAAGVEKPAELNAREMFSDATRHHADEEIESYFTVGTMSTTPALAAIDSRWPKPWVFLRVFFATTLLYIGFLFAWRHFDNENLIPGLIMIGAVAVPFSLLIFFFEVNVPRNVSLYQVIKLFSVGGLVSIAVSLLFFDLTQLDSVLGASSAGIIEELGKGVTLLWFVTRPRFRWTLNGLLFGATVGTGFAVFETAGYALRAGLSAGGDIAMRETLFERGFLSILGGHVLWTALVGAALWRVRGDQPFRREMLVDPRFLRVLAIAMAMHMLWNWSAIDFPLHAKELVLGAAAWMLVLGFLQSGLKQVRDAQAAIAVSATTIAS